MDETDVALSRLMMRNSRTSYSDLGKELGMTPQAVHRRIQSLMEQKVIRGTYATLSFKALGRMWVVVQGWSRAPSMAEVDRALRGVPQVAVFQVASGNYVYVHGGARNAVEMDELVSKVTRLAQISEPQVGIVPTPPSEGDELSLMDLRIIDALSEDARRPVSEIAEELGTTPKTVRRRLDRLVEKDLIMMSIHWQPDSLGDVVSQVHLVLKEDVPREKAAFLIIKKYAPSIMRTYTFINKPDFVMVTFCSSNVREMQRTCDELESEGVFVSVVPNIIRDIYYYRENREGEVKGMLRERGERRR